MCDFSDESVQKGMEYFRIYVQWKSFNMKLKGVKYFFVLKELHVKRHSIRI